RDQSENAARLEAQDRFCRAGRRDDARGPEARGARRADAAPRAQGARPTRMNRNSRIYVAGHSGLAGSALVRRLRAKGYGNLLTRTHAELELTDAHAVRRFFE